MTRNPLTRRGFLTLAGAVSAGGLLGGGLVEEVLAEAVEQERMEAWIMDEIGRGAALPGLYPMNAETKARYEVAKKGKA